MRGWQGAAVVVLCMAGLGALGYLVGSQFHYTAKVAHFTTPEINSYMDIEQLTYAPDLMIGGMVGGLLLGIFVYIYRAALK